MKTYKFYYRMCASSRHLTNSNLYSGIVFVIMWLLRLLYKLYEKKDFP